MVCCSNCCRGSNCASWLLENCNLPAGRLTVQSCSAWHQCSCRSVSQWCCRQQPDNIPPAFASAVGGLLELRAQNLEIAIHGQVRPPRPIVRFSLKALMLQLCKPARCGLLLSQSATLAATTKSNVGDQAVLPCMSALQAVPHFLALCLHKKFNAALACMGLCLQLRAQLNMVATA